MSSWNDVTKKVRGMRKNFAFRCAISFVAVLASALLQSYVILAFIRPAGLLSSGFTGLAILIDRITELIFRIDFPGVSCPESPGRTHVLPQH